MRERSDVIGYTHKIGGVDLFDLFRLHGYSAFVCIETS